MDAEMERICKEIRHNHKYRMDVPTEVPIRDVPRRTKRYPQTSIIWDAAMRKMEERLRNNGQ